MEHDTLVLIAALISTSDRLLRLAPVCKTLQEAAYVSTTAVVVSEPADLAYLPSVDTVTIEAPLKDYTWLQGCAQTLTSLELSPNGTVESNLTHVSTHVCISVLMCAWPACKPFDSNSMRSVSCFRVLACAPAET